MLDLMTRHPRSVGESYGEHLAVAGSFSASLFAASLLCLAHGLLPFLFEATTSRTIERLHRRISRRAAAAPRPVQADATA